MFKSSAAERRLWILLAVCMTNLVLISSRERVQIEYRMMMFNREYIHKIYTLNSAVMVTAAPFV